MSTKFCIKCNEEKELTEFYKQKACTDGHVNQCKTCRKKKVIRRYHENSSMPGFFEKERIIKTRSRKKHKPRSTNLICRSKFRDTHRLLSLNKGEEAHHWNYNQEFILNVFVLNISNHKRIHLFLKYDSDILLYRTKEGELLDTREKHGKYITKSLKEYKEYIKELINS